MAQRGVLPPTQVHAEVTIRPVEGRVPGKWCAAGLAVRMDDGNYWRLALVENADDKSLRYFELVEERNGIWQAQSTGATRLTSKAEESKASWDYGKSYRFVIELNATRCEGKVFEKNKLIWRQSYIMPRGTSAVRSGMPALCTVSMRAEFRDFKADLSFPKIASEEKQPTAILLQNDLPGNDSSIEPFLSQALSDAGFVVRAVPVEDFRSSSKQAANLLVVANAQTLPFRSAAEIERHLSAGGNLMLFSTDVPFQRLLLRFGGEWTTADEAQARVPVAKTVFRIADDTPNHLAYATGSPQRPDPILQVEAASKNIGGKALSTDIPEFDSWNTWTTRVVSGALSEKNPVLVFWARGSKSTPYLVIELDEDDESRWIATVPLETKWRRFALRPQQFHFWQDCAARGRRGYEGDQVRPEHVNRLSVGLAKSHAPLSNGRKRFWVSNFYAAPLLPELQTMPQKPSIYGVSPWYKTFRFPNADRIVEAGGPFELSETLLPRGGLRCTYARPWGRTLTNVRTRRCVPLLMATSGNNYEAPAAALYVCSGGRFTGSSWSYWGLRPPVPASQKKALSRFIGRIARAQARRLWLLEAGATQPAYMPDQPVRIGARIVNASAKKKSVALKLTVSQAGKTLLEKRVPLLVPASDEITWTTGSDRLQPGEYVARIELRFNEERIDEIDAPFRVLSGKPPRENTFVRVRNGRFEVGGKPWYPHGVNYWPRYVSGMDIADYRRGWLCRRHYDPELIEQDLAIAERLGITSLSIQPPRERADIPCLWDFLARCEHHGIRVNLFLPADPRGFDKDYVRMVIEDGRLKNFPTLWAYDITWEPRWGGYAQRSRYDKQWTAWVTDQYGSQKSAERVWNFRPPRHGDGSLSGPSDEQLAKDGPWRVFVAAYRRFVDDYLTAGYRRACRFIRSLDPNHLISNRAGWGGTGNPGTVRNYQFDPLSGAAYLDFISPEAYGMQAKKDDYKRWGFIDAYCRWAGNGKPVFWSEYGASLYPGYRREDYQKQRMIWENIQRLVLFAGADGDAGWWWPGGYRVDERSDFGCIEPWGEPRPSALELQRWAPRIFHRRPETRPLAWLVIDRDETTRGLAGLWEKHLGEYLKLVDSGKFVKFRTPVGGFNTVNAPIHGVGLNSYPGRGPAKFLNALLDGVCVRTEKGVFTPTKDMLWGQIAIDVPGNFPAWLELRFVNTGVLTWACAKTANGRPGAVGLIDLRSKSGVMDVPKDVERYNMVVFKFPIMRTPQRGKTTSLAFQLEADGRCRFGQVVKLLLRGK